MHDVCPERYVNEHKTTILTYPLKFSIVIFLSYVFCIDVNFPLVACAMIHGVRNELVCMDLDCKSDIEGYRFSN